MTKRLEFAKAEGKALASGTIITDTQTGVQYLLASQNGVGVAMTVLVDANGKPVSTQNK